MRKLTFNYYIRLMLLILFFFCFKAGNKHYSEVCVISGAKKNDSKVAQFQHSYLYSSPRYRENHRRARRLSSSVLRRRMRNASLSSLDAVTDAACIRTRRAQICHYTRVSCLTTINFAQLHCSISIITPTVNVPE